MHKAASHTVHITVADAIAAEAETETANTDIITIVIGRTGTGTIRATRTDPTDTNGIVIARMTRKEDIGKGSVAPRPSATRNPTRK